MDTRKAVRQYIASVRAAAGGAPALARAIERHWGELPAQSTVNAWAQGRNEVPGSALFAMLRAFPGHSLDEAALGPDERTSLLEEVREAREHLAVIQAAVNGLLRARGDPPMEFPRPRAEGG